MVQSAHVAHMAGSDVGVVLQVICFYDREENSIFAEICPVT